MTPKQVLFNKIYRKAPVRTNVSALFTDKLHIFVHSNIIRNSNIGS